MFEEELEKANDVLFTVPKSGNELEKELTDRAAATFAGSYRSMRMPGGTDRNDMPSIPEKSERIRRQERPQIYPFSTIPVEELERGMILKQF